MQIGMQKKRGDNLPPKKAGLYIRVSTDAQREEGYSIDAQREMLQAHCVSKGIKNYEFYVDGGFTGSNIARPALTKLIEEINADLISHVIVYKLDRLSRSQKDALYLIEDVFNPHGVAFTSMNENMDTSTPMGRLMLGILAAFAQLERENIKERTRMGMKERVKSGLWMGGGKIPFGYDYNKKSGILVPNEDAAKVRLIYDLYLQGYAAQNIATMLGLTYEKLVMQILTRKTNMGMIVYNNEEYVGLHEAIISPEVYAQTMEMMACRSVNKTPTTNYLLTGLVYCGKCGAKMRYQKWGKAGVKLCCYSRQKSKPYLVHDPNCDNENVWAGEVEDIVVLDLKKLNIAREESDTYSGKKLTVLDMLMQQYEICSGKIKKLYNLYAKSSDEILLDTINENKQELMEIKEKMEAQKVRSTANAKKGEIKEMAKNLSQMWDHMTIAEQQQIVRSCISKIAITDNVVSIYYTF